MVGPCGKGAITPIPVELRFPLFLHHLFRRLGFAIGFLKDVIPAHARFPIGSPDYAMDITLIAFYLLGKFCLAFFFKRERSEI